MTFSLWCMLLSAILLAMGVGFKVSACFTSHFGGLKVDYFGTITLIISWLIICFTLVWGLASL